MNNWALTMESVGCVNGSSSDSHTDNLSRSFCKTTLFVALNGQIHCRIIGKETNLRCNGLGQVVFVNREQNRTKDRAWDKLGVTSAGSNSSPLTTIDCELSPRKAWIQLRTFDLIPYWSDFHTSLEWLTLSSAFEK